MNVHPPESSHLLSCTPHLKALCMPLRPSCSPSSPKTLPRREALTDQASHTTHSNPPHPLTQARPVMGHRRAEGAHQARPQRARAPGHVARQRHRGRPPAQQQRRRRRQRGRRQRHQRRQRRGHIHGGSRRRAGLRGVSFASCREERVAAECRAAVLVCPALCHLAKAASQLHGARVHIGCLGQVCLSDAWAANACTHAHTHGRTHARTLDPCRAMGAPPGT